MRKGRADAAGEGGSDRRRQSLVEYTRANDGGADNRDVDDGGADDGSANDAENAKQKSRNFRNVDRPVTPRTRLRLA